MAETADTNPVDALLRRLAEIQDALIDLPSDAFAERADLRAEQDRVRGEVARALPDPDQEATLDQLRAKLEHVQGKLEAHFGNRLSHTSGWQSGMGGGTDPAALAAMNRAMDRIGGLDELRAEVARLKDRLSRLESDHSEAES